MEKFVIAAVVFAGVYAVVRMYMYKRMKNGTGSKDGSGFPTDPK